MKSSNGTKISHSVWVLAGLMLSGLLGRAGISLAAEDTWTFKNPIPTGRGFTSGAVVDGKIYVIGGFLSHSSITAANEMYDPATDQWTVMEPMPQARCGHATCSCNGKIYVFGGVRPNPYGFAKNNVYEYDPQTDTWAQKADMPYEIAFCGIAVLNDTIYLIGGTTNCYTPPIKTVMAYDPVTESWIQKADMLNARSFLSACVADGKIYTFGGGDENLHNYAFDYVEVYDPATNTWTAKTNMPTGRLVMGTCHMDGKIYAVGGWRIYTALPVNEMYDTATDTWTTKSPIQQRRLMFFFGSVGNKIYAIGGSYPDSHGNPIIPTSVEEYDTGLSVLSPDFNIGPVADAGLPRYAAQDPVVLDGTGSYDPDDSDILNYSWRQISGPSVEISEADTASPTISGFVQTDAIQECEFELVVSNGQLTSLPDTVKVIIVPDFGVSTFRQENPPFDPNKPTVIYFYGGDCRIGFGKSWTASAWKNRANVISFPSGYRPDSGGGGPTYYKYGDMIIVYLSAVAPDYKQPIQTIGASTGGMPATDVGIRLNSLYQDARYAVNRVTHLEAPCRLWNTYLDAIELFLTSSVDGEQCWIDHYYGAAGHAYEPFPRTDILWVRSGLSHDPGIENWYRNSLAGNDMNKFNSGVVAGAYWSVIGPGKNLQLAPHTDAYYFRWDGGEQSGSMNFHDEVQFPGRLPEPVTLIGPSDGAVVDANGVVLSCEVSENAIGYQLLFGSEPYRVMDYMIVSDTPLPPSEVITSFPYEQTWWTIKVYDAFGSTIYADPVCVYPEKVEAPEPGLIDDVRIYNRAVRP